MHFKNLIVLFLCCSGVAFLTTCNDEGEGTIDPSNIRNTEDISYDLAGLNFVIYLENGKRLNFTLGVEGSEPSITNFVDEGEGINFVNANVLQLTPDGGARLIVGQETFVFDYLLCTTIRELEANYTTYFSSNYRNFDFYVAVEIDAFTEQEVINGQPIENYNYLYFFVDPDANYLFGAMYTRTFEREIYLNGTLEKGKGGEIHGFGAARIYMFDNFGNYTFNEKDFEVEMNCK